MEPLGSWMKSSTKFARVFGAKISPLDSKHVYSVYLFSKHEFLAFYLRTIFLHRPVEIATQSGHSQ
jgi:hypothetical protein